MNAKKEALERLKPDNLKTSAPRYSEYHRCFCFIGLIKICGLLAMQTKAQIEKNMSEARVSCVS
jgi:hypothetical protein